MESFCVEKGDNTAQDIQDLFDLAVWAGAYSDEAVSVAKRCFYYDIDVDFDSWDYFGVGRINMTIAHDDYRYISNKVITYEQAINHILNGE